MTCPGASVMEEAGTDYTREVKDGAFWKRATASSIRTVQ